MKPKLQEHAASKADQARRCKKEYPKPDKLQVWVASKLKLGWAYVQGVDPAAAAWGGMPTRCVPHRGIPAQRLQYPCYTITP